MHVSVIALLWACVSYVIYSVASRILLARHINTRRRELKCGDVPTLPSKLPFGLSLIQEALAADKALLFPLVAINRHERMGTMTFKGNLLGMTMYGTSDPKNIQAMLATQFADFDLPHLRRLIFRPLLGEGIFTQNGKAWEHSRAMMRPQFARDQVSDLELEEVHVQHLLKVLPVQRDGWTEQVDLNTLFFRLTLDSATQFLFGESVDSQLADPASIDDHDFGINFDAGQAALSQRFRLNSKYWILNSPLFPKTRDDFFKNCKDVQTFIDHFVRRALSAEVREKELEKGTEKQRYVFLEALAQETQDPVELRSQLLHILLAGRDTTASLLGWLFYCLARDPARYTKLRQVVLDNFGTDNDSITFSSLKSCNYLQHCLSEALRLYPVVPVNGRQANKDTTLPRGGGPDGTLPVFIPKGTMVDYSVHVMHHNPDFWGADAEDFRPERFEGRKAGWEYLPFNGGPRICIGQQFALTEASYVTARVLQRFDALENCETDPVVRHFLGLTNCSGTGVKVRLHAAET